MIAGSGRIPLTADQRRRLAVVGRALSPEERKKSCQIVKPGTILGWFPASTMIAGRQLPDALAARAYQTHNLSRLGLHY